MLKIIKLLFVLFFASNCSSIPFSKPEITSEYEKTEISSVGCAKYRGREWSICIDKVLKEYEQIHNSTPTEKLIKEESYSKGDFFYRTINICFGPVCKKRNDRIYDPSTGKIFKRYVIIYTVGIITGAVVVAGSGGTAAILILL